MNRRFLTGVEYEFTGVRGVERDCLHVFLDSHIARGYIAWVVPGVGITQVGVASSQPHAPRLDRFLGVVERLFDFSRAQKVGHRGGLIPCGGVVRPFASDRLMLLGDAAGMVSPLTAGGIHPALETGRAAGVAVGDFLSENGPDPAIAVRKAAPSFRYKRLLRAIAGLPVPNVALNLLFATPIVRAFAQAVFYHHRGLFSSGCWREIVVDTARAMTTAGVGNDE